MYRTSQSLIVAVAIVAAGMFPRQVSGQASHPTASNTARAVALETRAAQAPGLPAAARLREQAAELRAPGDPAGVTDLLIAAGARYFSGNAMYARELYVRAAERALADGDVNAAAHGFIAAAFVAKHQHDAVALDLKARAERLAGSPLLSATQRRLILGYFAAPMQVAERQP